jgi:hypothetical protein
MKTYTADTGYVYQYYFVGKREALADAPEAPATEYVFDVTADRKSLFAMSVFLRADALEAWAFSHGRSLTEAEQYAAAKLRLLHGLDEIQDLSQNSRRLALGPEEIESVLSPLDLD